jgi:hypothetical protein
MTSAEEPLTGHVDSDTLALLALGEPVSDDVSAHVRSCGLCSDEVQSLRPVVALGRALQPEDMVPAQPPALIWERIAAETGVHSATGAEKMPAGPLAGLPGPASLPGPAGARSAGDGRSASAGNRRLAWLVAAAVVGALVGAAGTLGWKSLQGSGSDVVESATLRPLPAKQGTGSAEVRDVADGRELSVRITARRPPRAYLEVWLMSDPRHLVSLGALESSSGTFALPPGLDLARYKIVDVSVEPYDGNPAHSTDSLVRGSLGPT